MELLKNKKILITGIYNTKSIAFEIAKSMHTQKAELGFVCQNEKISNKIKKITESMNSNIILTCDFSNDKNIKSMSLKLLQKWKKFDGIIHSIAYCPKQFLNGDFIDNITRTGFNIAHEISCYSFLGLVKVCRTMLNNHASLLTLSYLGSKRVVPNYHLMGLSKASLEASVRYMAYTLGKNNIRVNAISSGPIKTISSYGIKDFKKIQKYHCNYSLIKKLVTGENIGNVASFLLSNLSIGITGSVIYVDNGFNVSAIR